MISIPDPASQDLMKMLPNLPPLRSTTRYGATHEDRHPKPFWFDILTMCSDFGAYENGDCA